MQIENLLKTAKVKPVVNQVELHPYLNQTDLINYCKSHGIAITAYSPLGSTPRSDGGGHSSGVHERPSLLENPVITAIAENHEKTAAQVLIRYVFLVLQFDITKASNYLDTMYNAESCVFRNRSQKNAYNRMQMYLISSSLTKNLLNLTHSTAIIEYAASTCKDSALIVIIRSNNS